MKKAFEIILSWLHKRLDFHENRMAELGGTERDVEDWGSVKAYSDAIDIVEKVAEEYKGCWIPCSERLPEKNGMYLCTQNNYDLVTNKNIIRVSTELVEFYNGKWRRAKNLVVTHWQPLPEPYKEVD